MSPSPAVDMALANPRAAVISKWIEFVLQMPVLGRKTDVWAVFTLDGAPLGVVKWFGRWRQYAFYPDTGSIYERQCLRDIADFCEQETEAYRQRHASIKGRTRVPS